MALAADLGVAVAPVWIQAFELPAGIYTRRCSRDSQGPTDSFRYKGADACKDELKGGRSQLSMNSRLLWEACIFPEIIGLGQLCKSTQEAIGTEPTTQVCDRECGRTEAALLRWIFSTALGRRVDNNALLLTAGPILRLPNMAKLPADRRRRITH